MNLVLHNHSTIPPGGWRYRIQEIDRWVEAPLGSWDEFIGKVKGQYRAANLPCPFDISARVETAICQGLGSDWCGPEGEGVINKLFGVDIETVSRFTATMIDWLVFNRAKKVPRPEADARAAVCRNCALNSHITGCTTCSNNKLLERISKVIPAGDQAPGLEGCKVCGCALQVKRWIPLDIIQRHEPESIWGQYPDWCWLKRG